MSEFTDCDECPLNEFKGQKIIKVYSKGRRPFDVHAKEIGFRGRKDSRFLIVGDCPSALDVANGTLFFPGGNDRLINAIKQGARGRVLPYFYHGAACRCHILNDRLTDSQVNNSLKACRGSIAHVIEALRPSVILSLGKNALRTLTGKRGIKGHRGRPIFSEEFNTWIMPTFSPGFCEIRPDNDLFFYPDIAKALDILFTGGACILRQVKQDFKEADDLSEILDKSNIMTAFDTETQGLDWTNPNSLTISYSISHTVGQGINLQLWEEVNEGEPYDSIIDWPRGGKDLTEVFVKKSRNHDKKIADLKTYFARKDIKKIMMNGNYDKHRVLNLGITDIKNYTLDIQSGAHTMYSDLLGKKTSLGELQSVFANDLPDHKTGFKETVNMSDMLVAQKDDPIRHMVYSCGDTSATLAVGHRVRNDLLADQRLTNYYTKFVQPVTSGLLFEIERTGIRFDVAGLPEAKAGAVDFLNSQSAKVIAMMPEEIRKDHAVKGLKLTRPDLIRDTIFSKKGFNLPRLKDKDARTKTGASSIGQPILRRMKENLDPDSEAFNFITEYLEWAPFQKLNSTYLNGVGGAVRGDGKLHTKIALCTGTGRTASWDPNMQNIPKRNKVIANIIRKLLIASPGYVLMAKDYSQNELRWVAYRSREPNFLETYRTGGDIHTRTAMMLLKLSGVDNPTPEMVTKEMRQSAKAINFGFIYGMGAPSFRRYAKDNYGVSINDQQAVDYRNAFLFDEYRGLPPWHEQEIAYAIKHGHCRSHYGRIRRLPNVTSYNWGLRGEAERCAINTPIQGPGSDSSLLGGQVALEKKIIDGKDCRVVGFVHDELIFEIKEGLVDKISPQLDDCLVNLPTEKFGFKMDVPLVVDSKVGYNLAEMEEYGG